MNPFDVYSYNPITPMPSLEIPQEALDALSTPPYMAVDDARIPDNIIPKLVDFQKSLAVEQEKNLTEQQKKAKADEKLAKEREQKLNNLISESQQTYQEKPLFKTHSGEYDIRYNDPLKPFAYGQNMEQIYEEDQGITGAFGVQFGRAWKNMKDFLSASYIGDGRLSKNAVNSSGPYSGLTNTSLNTPEQFAILFENQLNDARNPIYNTDPNSTHWFSPRGALGDFVASSGFSIGGAVKAGIDYGVGKGMQALAASGAGLVVLAAASAGTAAMFSDDVRDKVGENNANLIIGIMAGGATSLAMTKGIDKVFGASKAPGFLNAFKEAYNPATKGAFLSAIRGSISKNFAGTVFNPSGLSKSLVAVNTARRITKGLFVGGKMYASSGAEAGMEALQAQADHISKKLEKDASVLKDDKYYKKLFEETKSMGQDVYDANKWLLAATGSTQLYGVLTGSIAKGLEKSLAIKLIHEGGKAVFKNDFSVLKELGKTFLVDNISEGFEEGAQYAISEGNKKYLLEKETGKSKLEQYLQAAKETVTTSEGWGNIIMGMASGFAVSGVTRTTQGVQSMNAGKGFLAGFANYDKEYTNNVVDALNSSMANLNETLIQTDKLRSELSGITSDDTFITKKVKDIVENAIYEQVSLSMRFGTYQDTRSHIEDLFSSIEMEDGQFKDAALATGLMASYGDKQKTEEQNIEAIKKEGESLLKKMDKAKASIEQFTEFYSNPYTVSKIDSLFMDKDKQEAIKEKAEIFNNLVNVASRTFFLNSEHSKRIDALSKDLSGLFSQLPVDPTGLMDHLVGGQANGWDLYKEKLESHIKAIEASIAVVAPGSNTTKKELEDQLKKARMYRDKIIEFEDNIKKETEVTERLLTNPNIPDSQKEIIRKGLEIKSKKFNPTLTFLKFIIHQKNHGRSKKTGKFIKFANFADQETTGLDFGDAALIANPTAQEGLNWEIALRDIETLNVSKAAFSYDLKGLTSVDKQKAVIDELYELKQLAKKNAASNPIAPPVVPNAAAPATASATAQPAPPTPAASQPPVPPTSQASPAPQPSTPTPIPAPIPSVQPVAPTSVPVAPVTTTPVSVSTQSNTATSGLEPGDTGWVSIKGSFIEENLITSKDDFVAVVQGYNSMINDSKEEISRLKSIENRTKQEIELLKRNEDNIDDINLLLKQLEKEAPILYREILFNDFYTSSDNNNAVQEAPATYTQPKSNDEVVSLIDKMKKDNFIICD